MGTAARMTRGGQQPKTHPRSQHQRHPLLNQPPPYLPSLDDDFNHLPKQSLLERVIAGTGKRVQAVGSKQDWCSCVVCQDVLLLEREAR